MAEMQQPQMMPQQMAYQSSPYSYFQPSQMSYPMTAYQQRLQNMEQQYPHLIPQQYQQQQQQLNQQNQQSLSLKGRAVTGVDEAKAASIDFDGSVHYFTDIANGFIYTKQIGLNGAAEFSTYKLQPKEIEKQPEETKTAIVAAFTQDDFNALQQRINGLETKINMYEEILRNGNKSNASNASTTREQQSDGATTAVCVEQSGNGSSDKNVSKW